MAVGRAGVGESGCVPEKPQGHVHVQGLDMPGKDLGWGANLSPPVDLETLHKEELKVKVES